MKLLFALATITLSTLSNYQGEEVEIRGFLHEMPQGEWVLSTLPNARSCCITPDQPRLVVQGDFKPPAKSQAITLRGKLVQKEGFYVLENAAIVYKTEL